MTTEILIYGEIGFDVTSQYVAGEIAAADGDDLHVRFNTPGGVGSEGIAIYNRLSEYPGHVRGTIDGVCASAGMIAACACDELEMAANAFAMVHNSWMGFEGNADELDQLSRSLRKFDQHQAKIYTDRTGLPLDQIQTLMQREQELDAQEALSLGFVDSITGESRIAANLNKEKIMARSRTQPKKPVAKKSAPKRPAAKKRPAKKAKTRAALEIEEVDDDEEGLETEDPNEMMLDPEDDQYAEDDQEQYAEDDEDMMSEDDEDMMSEDDEDMMSEDDDPVPAAGYRQIVRACSGINPQSSRDAKFIARAQSKGLTIGQARSAWMRELKARLDRGAGVDPVRSSGKRSPNGSHGGNAAARFNAAVRERMRTAKVSRAEAVKIVCKSNPDLHKAYTLELNPGRKKRDLIEDRFSLNK